MIHTSHLVMTATVFLTACSSIRLIPPAAQDVGHVMVDTMYHQQSQQQCASGGDAYARLQCQRQAQQQMQQFRKAQQKAVSE